MQGIFCFHEYIKTLYVAFHLSIVWIINIIMVFQIHQFEIVLPPEHKRRLLKRLLKHKGVDFVEFEPENHRIIIKTRRSVHTILSILRSVDPSARLLKTNRDCEESRERDVSEGSGR